MTSAPLLLAAPVYRDNIYTMDALAFLRCLPPDSVDCCVSSPPYYGLRDYGTARWDGGDPACDHKVGRFTTPASDKQRSNNGSGDVQAREVCPRCGARRIDAQIGLEDTPAAFVARLVEVYREVRRVLKPSGVAWLNLGDSYANDEKWGGSTGGKHVTALHGDTSIGRERKTTGLPGKNLLMMPARVALALQADGWIVRRDIPWLKASAMPESVTDRESTAHEYVFCLVKSPRYWRDMDAIRVKGLSESTIKRYGANGEKAKRTASTIGGDAMTIGMQSAFTDWHTNPAGRNRRTTDWYYDAIDMRIADLQAELTYLRKLRTDGGALIIDGEIDALLINPEPTPFAHFATFAQKLIEPLIASSCPAAVCARCGKPYVRQTQKVGERQVRWSATNSFDGYRQRTHQNVYDTLGFAPSCDCRAGTVPGICLDPFMGSGTVALVARRLGRSYIGCDLNPAYVQLCNDRLGEDWTPPLPGIDAPAPQPAAVQEALL